MPPVRGAAHAAEKRLGCSLRSAAKFPLVLRLARLGLVPVPRSIAYKPTLQWLNRIYIIHYAHRSRGDSESLGLNASEMLWLYCHAFFALRFSWQLPEKCKWNVWPTATMPKA